MLQKRKGFFSVFVIVLSCMILINGAVLLCSDDGKEAPKENGSSLRKAAVKIVEDGAYHALDRYGEELMDNLKKTKREKEREREQERVEREERSRQRVKAVCGRIRQALENSQPEIEKHLLEEHGGSEESGQE